MTLTDRLADFCGLTADWLSGSPPRCHAVLVREDGCLGAVAQCEFGENSTDVCRRRVSRTCIGAIVLAATQVEHGAMIGFLVAGLVIGALARLIKPGRQNLGILATLLLGLVGSLIGGAIAWALGTGSIWELDVLGFVLAVIAAVLLIGAAEGVAGSRHRSVR
jgi:uncharacterized membrane protein YeaQ/YmgE (transglycosylase-associated protein family)